MSRISSPSKKKLSFQNQDDWNKYGDHCDHCDSPLSKFSELAVDTQTFPSVNVSTSWSSGLSVFATLIAGQLHKTLDLVHISIPCNRYITHTGKHCSGKLVSVLKNYLPNTAPCQKTLITSKIHIREHGSLHQPYLGAVHKLCHTEWG